MNAPERTAWLMARRTGIGGSDISAVLGLNPWRSAVDLYLDKRGELPDEEQPNEERMYWGNVLEPVVAAEFAQRTGRRVQRVNSMIRADGKPWALANIDRAIVAEGSRARLDANGRLQGADGLLEVKTANERADKDWRGDDGSDALPVYYTAQCMWYLGVADQQTCEVAALIGGQRYVHRTVQRDEDTIAGLFARAEEFWFRHVIAGVPPAPRSAADVLRLFPSDLGDVIEVGERADLLIAINDYRAARDRAKTAESDVDALAEQLKLAIGAASALVIDGKPAVTWKAAKGTQKTDWEAIAKALQAAPELIQQHTTTKPGSRRFLVKD